MEKINNSKFQVRLPIILAVGVAAGILIGATFAGSDNPNSNFMKGVMKFREVMSLIDKSYVDSVNTDELVESAVIKMLENLDPHTVYVSAKDVELANSDLKKEFEGVGIEFNIFRDTIVVLTPLSDGPSEKAGLMSGDKIINVEGETVAGVGITNRGVIDRLRGKKGTEVKVGIKRQRNSQLLDFTIIRDKIPQYSVDAGYMVTDEIGYIKVNRFAESTFDEFKEKLKLLKDQGMKKLILDLQSNPGGYMDRAVNMADELIPGNPMIVSQEGKEPRANAEYKAYREGLFETGTLIVLINEGSASGSEIVAGAIQDNDRGLIVGRRSFGKGLVQSMFRLSDGSELRLTISRYYTPSGRSIQRHYEKGFSEYENDFHSRVEKGELFHSDSIRFADTLKFQTSKGRIVYGGGGIMPDHFIPLDTTTDSNYYIQLLNTNILREYALEYYQKNQKKLEKMEFEQFRKEFQVDDTMIGDITGMAVKAGVPFDEGGYKKSEPVIKAVVKATIARSVWGRESFYPIINEVNEIFQESLRLFGEAEELAAM
ncbi:MAG: S41 family peptidase [Cyclobacteriaceae bacterium]|nr:S41 family peptidase [Cyclobacteriaceae bacterium]